MIKSDNNIGQEYMNFPKIKEPPQKSRCQNGDDKRGPTVKHLVAQATFCSVFLRP